MSTVITLKTYAPRAFYVLENEQVVVAFPPECGELVERVGTKKMLDMRPRLLSRRERRAALKAADIKWPSMGTAPARHSHTEPTPRSS